MSKKGSQIETHSIEESASLDCSGDQKELRRKTLDLTRVSLLPPSLFKGLRAFLVLSQDRTRTYLILENVFCSCPDFIARSLLRSEKPYCYHIEGLKLIKKDTKKSVRIIEQFSNLTDIRAQIPWF